MQAATEIVFRDRLSSHLLIGAITKPHIGKLMSRSPMTMVCSGEDFNCVSTQQGSGLFGYPIAAPNCVRRTRLIPLTLAMLGLCAYISFAAPITLVRGVGHPIAYGYQRLPNAVPHSRLGHSGLTGIVALLIAIRTLNPQKYRAVEWTINVQR